MRSAALAAALLVAHWASHGAAQAPAVTHLKTSGTQFVRADGRPFPWRGISAFRLLEMEAGGRAAEADAYLRWAAAERLTVVRVLVMAKHLFALSPERGVAALDALLARAARHGLHVEVVALADTASYDMDIPAHVRRVGEISARHANAIVEIANEPYHPTQRAEVHDSKYLERLRAGIPRTVPVALGAGEHLEMLAGGDYVTVHFPRSIAHDGWGWVAALASGARLGREAGKPIIDDEPLGAGARFEPGRRDADPEKFRAAALAGRLTGLGATFHYEGGLQARVPQGKERECLSAWQQAWTLIRGDAPLQPFEPGPSAPVRSVKGTHAGVFLGSRGTAAWVLIAGADAAAGIDPAPDWTVTSRHVWAKSRLYVLSPVTARTPR